MTRFHADPDFEPRVADWLELDPDSAPGTVLDTVLAAFPSIPQRRAARGPRRFPSMSRLALMGGVAALVAAVGLGGLIASSRLFNPDPRDGIALPASPSPVSSTPRPTASAIQAMTKRFVSVKHPMSIGYPDGWVVTPANTFGGTIDQAQGVLNAYDAVATDGSRFIALSGHPPVGQTAAEWLSGFEVTAEPASCHPVPADRTSIAVGGATALLVADNCSSLGPYGRWYRAIAVADGLAFVFQLDTDTLDRSWFEALLREVQLDAVAGSRPTAPELGTLAERTSHSVGISIAYPSGWTEVAVPVGARSIGIQLGQRSEGLVEDVRFDAQWFQLAPGETGDEWIAARDVESQATMDCPTPKDSAIMIGGHAGVIIDGGCNIPGSRTHWRAVVVVGDRGYSFHMDATKYGEAAFRTLLANVAIDPTVGS